MGHPVMGRAIQRGVLRDRVAAPGASRRATPFNAISPPVSDSPQRAPNREGFEDHYPALVKRTVADFVDRPTTDGRRPGPNLLIAVIQSKG